MGLLVWMWLLLYALDVSGIARRVCIVVCGFGLFLVPRSDPGQESTWKPHHNSTPENCTISPRRIISQKFHPGRMKVSNSEMKMCVFQKRKDYFLFFSPVKNSKTENQWFTPRRAHCVLSPKRFLCFDNADGGFGGFLKRATVAQWAIFHDSIFMQNRLTQ